MTCAQERNAHLPVLHSSSEKNFYLAVAENYNCSGADFLSPDAWDD